MAPLNEVYPEDRALVEKLAKLQNMHQQIQNLRGLLPDRLLKPTRMALVNPGGVSPEKMAANLKMAATDGSRDIQRFKKDFNSPEMRELWSSTSTANCSQGRDSWTVDYQALAKTSNASPNAPTFQSNGNTQGPSEAADDIEKKVKQFSTTNSSVHVDFVSQPNTYPINVKLEGLSFQIAVLEEDDKGALSVRPLPGGQPSELESQIADHINQRNGSSGLEDLLTLLASYQGLKFRSCDECGSIFDDQMTYPLIRRRKATTDKDPENVEWQALHRSCSL